MAVERLLHLCREHCYGDTAGDLACVISAHPIGKDRKTDISVGGYTVFVVRTHHSRISSRYDLERRIETGGHCAIC